jgi:long-subunit acyl-CoA synthetase (AMP-forming)
VTWSEFCREVVAFGRFLSASGIERGDRVAMFSPNRREMLVTEFATMSLGAIFVPIFPGYAAEQARALVAQCRPTALVLPGLEQLGRTGVPPTARVVVTFEPVEPSAFETARGVTGADQVLFADALARFAVGGGDPALAAFLDQAAAVDPSDPALMMYTSGTSGRLKGVLLTHDNILSQQRALSAIWTVSPEDRFLSYLPWHHSFGGIFEKYTALYHGATLYLDDSAGKDFDRLIRNWKEVRPTIYFSVPKVYQELVAHAQAHPEDEREIIHPELRFVFTAAAPLPANLAAFFAERGIPVLEGWGLTETSPCCTVTDPAEPRTVPGMVGYPIPGVRLYLAPDGEILVQGPNVMRGYFDDPEATAKVLPGDGWFRTGDLGSLIDAGLRLQARKDRIFKMFNAEKIIPTELENRLAGMNPYIRHVIVVGQGRSHLAALIYPDYFRIAQEFGEDRATADRVVKESIRDTVLAFNRDHPIPYEHILALAVITRELSIEHNELTPSLKLRVSNVLEQAEPYLEAVYEPSADCDCTFLRKVMRMDPDTRQCFAGLECTLDHCHECGNLLFGDSTSTVTNP